MMDYIHGGGESITEVFIPAYKICFNKPGGVFHSEEQRSDDNNITQIQLSKELVGNIVKCHNL